MHHCDVVRYNSSVSLLDYFRSQWFGPMKDNANASLLTSELSFQISAQQLCLIRGNTNLLKFVHCAWGLEILL